MKAVLTCPFCKHTRKIEVPKDRCLVLHKCEKFKHIIKSSDCCIICKYSDKKCPVSTS